MVAGVFSKNIFVSYFKKKEKKLVILDLKILNKSIDKCLSNINIYKIYSVFKFNSFDQYPKKFKRN